MLEGDHLALLQTNFNQELHLEEKERLLEWCQEQGMEQDKKVLALRKQNEELKTQLAMRSGSDQ